MVKATAAVVVQGVEGHVGDYLDLVLKVLANQERGKEIGLLREIVAWILVRELGIAEISIVLFFLDLFDLLVLYRKARMRDVLSLGHLALGLLLDLLDNLAVPFLDLVDFVLGLVALGILDEFEVLQLLVV